MQGVGRGIQAGLTVLVVICCIGLLSVAARSSSMVFDLPLTEDGYYVMTISRNVAKGVGFSVDGTTLTNGFQPLWGVLSALAFLVTGSADEPSIRIVLLASAALTILSAFLWASISAGLFGTDDRLYRLSFVLIYLTSFQLLMQHFNGLETGLVLVLMGAIGIYWCRTADPPIRRSAVLGVLIGFLVLARIDTGIFAALLAFEVAWRQRHALGQALAQVVLMAALATLIAGPWFAYNLYLTGKVVPVSGLTLGLSMDTEGPRDRLINALGAIARDGFPSILGEINRAVSLGLFLAACALAIFLLRRQWRRSPPLEAGDFGSRCRTYVAMIAVYLAILIVIYTVTNAATFFYTRYFILLSILAVGVFAFLLHLLARSRVAWLAMVAGGVLTGIGLATVLGWHGVPFGDRLNRLQAYRNGPCLEQVELAQRVRLPGEKVAALQTGTLAFFVEGAINLDGRVNFAAYQARLAGKLLDYVLDQRIGLLVDYDIHLAAGHFGYFQADENPRRYYRQIAPSDVPRPFDWVALRRMADAPAR